METPANSVESLIERVESYIKTTLELSKLRLLETSTVVATWVVSRISAIMMFSMFFVMLSIGVALYLGELLGKSYYGFFIVAGFYFFLAILLHYVLNKWIRKSVSNLIIKQFFKF